MADTDTGAEPLDQDALVADIDRTRAELARTIDAIADRVSPRKNIDRAMDQFRKNADRAVDQARKDADRALDQVRQRVSQIDPLVVGAATAVAVAVVGVTALFLLRRRRR